MQCLPGETLTKNCISLELSFNSNEFGREFLTKPSMFGKLQVHASQVVWRFEPIKFYIGSLRVVGAHEHQSIRIGVFQCLIRIVRMTLVSSRDFVKCRMSRTLFSCLLVAHWPDFRKLLFPDFRSFGSSYSGTCLSGLYLQVLNITPTYPYPSNLHITFYP